MVGGEFGLFTVAETGALVLCAVFGPGGGPLTLGDACEVAADLLLGVCSGAASEVDHEHVPGPAGERGRAVGHSPLVLAREVAAEKNEDILGPGRARHGPAQRDLLHDVAGDGSGGVRAGGRDAAGVDREDAPALRASGQTIRRRSWCYAHSVGRDRLGVVGPARAGTPGASLSAPERSRTE